MKTQAVLSKLQLRKRLVVFIFFSQGAVAAPRSCLELVQQIAAKSSDLVVVRQDPDQSFSALPGQVISLDSSLKTSGNYSPRKSDLFAGGFGDFIGLLQTGFFNSQRGTKAEQEVSFLEVVDLKKGKSIASDAAIKKEIWGHGGISSQYSINLKDSILFANGRLLFGKAESPDFKEADFFIYDLQTKNLRVLRSSSELPALSSLSISKNQRFIKATSRDLTQIWDLKTGESILVESREGEGYPNIQISADRSLLHFESRKGTNDGWLYSNFILNVSDRWNPNPQQVIRIDAEKPKADFLGRVLDASTDLRTFVVDKSSSKTVAGKYSAYPASLPKLGLFRLKPGADKVIEFSLPGWKQVAEKITQAAAQGLFIKFERMNGQMTTDGRFFALDLPFTQMVRVGSSEFQYDKDLVIAWDLETKAKAIELTSSYLDAANDVEPSPLAGHHTHMVWKRKFSYRLTDSNELVLARAIAHGQDRVAVKVHKSNLGSLPISFQQAAFDFSNIDLSPMGSTRWAGVTDLQIGPDGKKVIVDISKVGLKILDLSGR